MYSATTLIEPLGLLLLQHVFSFNSLARNMSHFDPLDGVFNTTTGAPAHVSSDLVIIQIFFSLICLNLSDNTVSLSIETVG